MFDFKLTRDSATLQVKPCVCLICVIRVIRGCYSCSLIVTEVHHKGGDPSTGSGVADSQSVMQAEHSAAGTHRSVFSRIISDFFSFMLHFCISPSVSGGRCPDGSDGCETQRKLSLKRDNDKVFFKNIITNTRNAESFCNFAIKIKS
jgi:hypothetical protein